MSLDFMPSIIERLSNNVNSRIRDTGSQESSQPISLYLDADRYAVEKQRLFVELPIVIGHASQIPRGGDFFTYDALGIPLLAVRQQDGQIGVFRNVCRHRSAIVETAANGNRSSFTCPYHAWSYDLGGCLTSVPDRSSFDDPDLMSRGLHPVTSATAHGLIFVRLSNGGPIDVSEYLGPLDAELAAIGLESHSFFSERYSPLKCNWKVMMEGSLETYHFKFLHAKSAGPIFDPMATIWDFFTPHQRFAMPTKRFANRVSEPERLRRDVLINYFIFPNTVLTFPNDHMTITQVFPTASNRCVFYNSLLTLETPEAAKPRQHWERALELTESVNDEDFKVLESIQRVKENSPDDKVVHGKFELGISHFHKTVNEFVTK